MQLGYSGDVAQRPIEKGGFLCFKKRIHDSLLHQNVAAFESLTDLRNTNCWPKVLFPNG